MNTKTKPTLGSALRTIRQERGWTLAQAAAHTGISISALSKIENGQRSLTYDKLIELASSLEVEITRLFSSEASADDIEAPVPIGRRSVQRQNSGFVIETGVYSYRYLAEDLIDKSFSPIIMELHARSLDEFDGLLRHSGEEFVLVLEGEVELRTDLYAPLRLKIGESIYFDSNMGHAYLNAGTGAAKILIIASNQQAGDNPLDQPAAHHASREMLP